MKCDDKFAVGTWRDNTDNVPYLVDAQSNIFCIVDGAMDYGTHTIFIGKVETILTADVVEPLIYQNGSYLGHA